MLNASKLCQANSAGRGWPRRPGTSCIGLTCLSVNGRAWRPSWSLADQTCSPNYDWVISTGPPNVICRFLLYCRTQENLYRVLEDRGVGLVGV